MAEQPGVSLGATVKYNPHLSGKDDMTLALRAAADVPDALEGVAAEIKTMASEVLADMLT
jgi:hypothetical protein